jgi:hypothetical protein
MLGSVIGNTSSISFSETLSISFLMPSSCVLMDFFVSLPKFSDASHIVLITVLIASWSLKALIRLLSSLCASSTTTASI